MKCDNCGAPDQTGKFCTECGSTLDGSCPECGAELAPGGSYCSQCGAAVAGEERGGWGGGRTGLIIAAVAVTVVALVLFFPRDTERAGPAGMTGPAPGAAAGSAAPTGGMGGFTGDMRTNADRLFNRIMQAAEQENQAEVDQFMPMAIQAYGMVEGLDDDGLYHLALLHSTAGEYEQARQAAQRILDTSPDHILALGAAAAAAAAAGDSAAAADQYQRLLDAYAGESGKPLPEYVDHQLMLEQYQQTAREYLEAR